LLSSYDTTPGIGTSNVSSAFTKAMPNPVVELMPGTVPQAAASPQSARTKPVLNAEKNAGD